MITDQPVGEKNMINIGNSAPDFTLKDHNKNDVTLSQYKEHKNVILSWHVLSFTSGWTDQVSLFRAAYSNFTEKDTQVLGISTNASASQAAYSASLGNIPYPILSDFYPQGKVAKSYGIFNEKTGTSFRSIVIIDKGGIIRFKRVYTKASDINTDEILMEVDRL